AASSRRDFLKTAAAGLAAGSVWQAGLPIAAGAEEEPKRIAAVVTEFRPRSHAEGIVGRWLEGFELDGQSEKPASRPVALYTDQVPKNDLSRAPCAKEGVSINHTIRETRCRGVERLAVGGVVLIGEHGSYPYNEKGQLLSPRRRFF